MYIPKDLGAYFKSPYEADPRDYKIEEVLGEPTSEELKALPESVDLVKKANFKLYFNQGCIPMCVPSAGNNGLALQEVIERNNNNIKPNACYNRINMGHKCECKEKGDFLEHFCKEVKNNGFEVEIDGKKYLLTVDGYAYSQANINTVKYRLYKGYPLYYATRGNPTMRKEMLKGEIKTIPSKITGGHAIIIYGYDENYIYFLNSWKPNDGDKYPADLSVFKVNKVLFSKLIQRNIFNRRFFIFYNHKDKTQWQKDIEAVEKAYSLGITKNKKEVEDIKKGKYTQDNKTTIKLMRMYNLLNNN